MKNLISLGIMFCLLICLHANAITPIRLCLTGKLQLTLPDYKIAFLNAVELAMSESKANKYMHVKTYFFDNKPLSALRTYHEMVKDQCSAIIGFEYLSDLLLVIKQQRDSKIPIFTSYASSSEADNLPINIFYISS